METYIWISQINHSGGASDRKHLAQLINEVVKREKRGPLSYKLIDRVLNHVAINLLAGKYNAIEEQRLRWKTYCNLKMWFENWKKELIELGFTNVDEHGNVSIKSKKMKDILNSTRLASRWMEARERERWTSLHCLLGYEFPGAGESDAQVVVNFDADCRSKCG